MTERLPRIALRLLAAVLALLLIWSAGLLWFITRVEAPGEAPPAQADGIIVLTGGAGRVERALHLLAEGRAERLLISGVGRTEFAELAARAGVDPALAPRVTLGRTAVNTRGNAQEAAEWAKGLPGRDGALIVVTSGYHMPRALAELRHALPNRRLHPVPVLLPADRPRLRLLAGEFSKFLAAEIGLSRLDPTR